MQPIDRDTQIELMKNSETRLKGFVAELLQVRGIRDAAKRCAFEERDVTYSSSSKTVKVARCA